MIDTDLVKDHYTWLQWNEAHPNADEETRLDALHSYIWETANEWVDNCTYDAAWANKKLAALGITRRIRREAAYDVAVTVTGQTSLRVYATTRAEALDRASTALAARRPSVNEPKPTSEFTIHSGPEDVADDVADQDAPADVPGALAKLRETILLGHIAGPHICEEEANKVLASFGLAPIPARKAYTVTRNVAATMATTVLAYDEQSAERVAGWRWNDSRKGYSVTAADLASDLVMVDEVPPRG